MKKYLFGIFAIVLAISFSAFTHHPTVQKAKTKILFYYWTDGTVLDNFVGAFDPVVDRNEILGHTGCYDETTTPCARGFLSVFPSSPSDPYADEITTTPPNK